MTDGETGIEVGFTEILYGVVIANGIIQMSFETSLRNGMILLAIIIILDDWLIYQVHKAEIERKLDKYFLAFIIDALTLMVWYFLTVAPDEGILPYLYILSFYFLLQALWDLVLLPKGWYDVVRGSHFQLFLASLSITLAYVATLISELQSVFLIALSFFIIRSIAWGSLFNDKGRVNEIENRLLK